MILEYVKVLIWPIMFVMTVALAGKTVLRDLMSRLRSADILGVKAEFAQVKEIADDLDEARQSIERNNSPDATVAVDSRRVVLDIPAPTISTTLRRLASATGLPGWRFIADALVSLHSVEETGTATGLSRPSGAVLAQTTHDTARDLARQSLNLAPERPGA
jgi:hypothetical protein